MAAVHLAHFQPASHDDDVEQLPQQEEELEQETKAKAVPAARRMRNFFI
ncbi:MAG: hypothetical protein ACJA1W_000144 [Akkermansiaceae bacterium]